MSLPWVSRDVVTCLREEVNRKTQELREAKDEYHALLDKYHALKVSGAVVPQTPVPREVDVVTQAVIAKSRGNPLLFKHFGTFVATQRAYGANEDSIAQEILNGVPDDTGLPL